MTTLTAADILEAALKLPSIDRDRIAQELWESIPPPDAASVSDPGLAAELDRRAQAHRDDPSRAIDWENARSEVLAALHEMRVNRATKDGARGSRRAC